MSRWQALAGHLGQSTMFFLPGAASAAPSTLGVASGTGAVEVDAGRTATGEDEVECDWDEMELGNQPGMWKTSVPAIKHAYDNNLQGQEVSAFWPGRAQEGECNDLTDLSRKCWYRGRMLNDIGCDAPGSHCLHMAFHDGMNRHTFTCPTWVRDSQGRHCKQPLNWQACPRKFTLKRVDTEAPQRFAAMLARSCSAPSKQDLAKKDVMLAKAQLAEALSEEKSPAGPAAPLAAGSKRTLGVYSSSIQFGGIRSGFATASGQGAHEVASAVVGAAANYFGVAANSTGAAANPGSAQPTTARHNAAALRVRMAYDEDTLGPGALRAPEPSGNCHENNATEGIEGKNAVMIFDIQQNKWHRCSKDMRCEPWFVQSIREGQGKCGPRPDDIVASASRSGEAGGDGKSAQDIRTDTGPWKGQLQVCSAEEQCFHHYLSSVRSEWECIPDKSVWVISASDEKARVEAAGASGPVVLHEQSSLWMAPLALVADCAVRLGTATGPPRRCAAKPLRLGLKAWRGRSRAQLLGGAASFL